VSSRSLMRLDFLDMMVNGKNAGGRDSHIEI
jgi:hypothetical protein